MTDDQANRYAIRYKNIWHGGPNTEELRHQFTKMDADTLATTFDRLARHEHPPSIATIWHTYQANTPTRYGWPRPTDTGPPISLDDYLTHHPDDTTLTTIKARHPSSP